MTNILPISELRDTTTISDMVNEGPVFVTKNGHGHLVVISMDQYNAIEKRIADLELKNRYYESKLDGKSMSADRFFETIRNERVHNRTFGQGPIRYSGHTLLHERRAEEPNGGGQIPG